MEEDMPENLSTDVQMWENTHYVKEEYVKQMTKCKTPTDEEGVNEKIEVMDLLDNEEVSQLTNYTYELLSK